MRALVAAFTLLSLAFIAIGCDFSQPDRAFNDAAVPPEITTLIVEDMEDELRLTGEVDLCVDPDRYDFEIRSIVLNIVRQSDGQPLGGRGGTPPCVRFNTFAFEGGTYELQIQLDSEEPVNGLLSVLGAPAVTLVGEALFDNRPPAEPQVQVVMDGFTPTLTWTYPGDPPPVVSRHVIERRVRSDRDASDYEVVATLGDERRFVDATFQDPIIATELSYRIRASNGSGIDAVAEASVLVGTAVVENLGSVRRLIDPVTGEALLLSSRFDLGTGEIVVLQPDGTVAQRVAVARPMDAGISTAEGRLFVLTEGRQRLEEWSRTTFQPLRDVLRLDGFLGAFTADATGRFYAGVEASDPNVGSDVLQIDLDTGETTRLILPPTDDGFPSNVAGLIVDQGRLYVVDSGFGFNNGRGRILVYDVSGEAPVLLDVRLDPDSFTGVIPAENGATLLLGQQPDPQRARWIERWDALTLETLSRFEVVAPGDDSFFFFASVGAQPLVGFGQEINVNDDLVVSRTRYRRLDAATGQFGPSTVPSLRGGIVDLGSNGVFSTIADLDEIGINHLWLLPRE